MAEPAQQPVPHPLPVPMRWMDSEAARTKFFADLSTATAPTLLCDYDGTLAPFQQDKMQAYAYPGVPERLLAIAEGPTRLCFVSGRPARELILLLPLAADAEIWGMHGREHRVPNGTDEGDYSLMEPSQEQRAALDQAQATLKAEGLAALVERKAASLALHWRSLESTGIDRARAQADAAFKPHAGHHCLAVLPFDGGLELRAEDQTKGHAAAALLAGSNARHAAFLGDDTTDEDAFQVMRARGGWGCWCANRPGVRMLPSRFDRPKNCSAFWTAGSRPYR
ncbi:trehalose-phosphatase [Acidipila sp. EB88]|uniref:trehalose-phosphatase n=1 Tax=Acidipila sp. EB88 TaxID=2305226 RepID=UPI000F5D961F|nr:trehalose-phosphatase [Acidipila sp. EB88]RRA48115.1 trehalose-phosphatase [Acidipila sp. EB88]